MKWNMRCPHCHAEFILDESHQGAIGQCGNCGKEFTIPADLAAFFADVPAPPLRQTPTRRMDPEPDPFPKSQTIAQSWTEPHAHRPFPGSTNLMYCPDCGQMVSRGANACPFCGARIPTDKPRPYICSVFNVFGTLMVLAGIGMVMGSCLDAAAHGDPDAETTAAWGAAILFFGLTLYGLSAIIARRD